MTGEYLIWCTREEHAGGALLDLQTSPPAYRHHRTGWCPCGTEHERRPPALRLPILARLAPAPEKPDDLPLRDAVYRTLLAQLTLGEDALADLSCRGLSAEEPAATGYRSLPRTLADRKHLLARLIDCFGEQDLRRVPGFTDKNGHLYFWYGDGYLVPYRAADGRITGLQCKLLGGKYLTARGSVTAQMHHLAGVSAPGGDLYLTEGGLKAEVAARLGNVAVFGVPGQSLTAEHVAAIRRLSPGRVIVTLDQEANAHTAQARQRWITTLAQAGLPTRVAVWEGTDLGGPKGIDDLFQMGGRPRIRRCTVTPPELTARRVPQPTTERGPIAGGLTLDQARARTRAAIRAFLAERRRVGGRALLVRAAPGTGKTHAVAEFLPRLTGTARLVVGTTALAQEQAGAHGYQVVHGRSPENCQRFDVVAALEQGDHDIARLACGSMEQPRCPFRATCAYWAQFAQPGPLIGATEQMFNSAFIRPARLVVVDDADLLRALIEHREMRVETLHRAIQQLARRRREPVLRLVRLLAHACLDAPPEWLLGPAVWDHLARTARRNGQDLVALVEALPKQPTLPDPDADAEGRVSAEAVEAVPPATILRVLRALQEELPAFRSGQDFNSRLRLRTAGIGVATLRPHALDGAGRPFVKEADLLVLDGTPIDSLVDHLTQQHERLPDVVADVRLPDSVQVVQHAGRLNGHLALQDPSTWGALVAEVAAERQRCPTNDPTKEAVVGYLSCTEALVDAGFGEAQVLSFGSLRGTNALAGVERLHVLGRPFPPPAELVYLAQVLHHDDEAPVSAQLLLTPRSYGGQPYQMDVVDFADPRVAELLQARREDELVQAIHRARAAATDPQLHLEETGAERRAVRLVLYSGHVLPGLRVDELVLSVPRTDVNAERAAEAAQRIQQVLDEADRRGERLSIEEVARRARAHHRTVAKYFGTPRHTLQRESLNRYAGLSQTGEPPLRSTPAPDAVPTPSTAPAPPLEPVQGPAAVAALEGLCTDRDGKAGRERRKGERPRAAPRRVAS